MVAARWVERAFPERIRESFREKVRAAETDRSGRKGEKEKGEAAPAPQPKNRSRK
jgi:hypothetical protein